MAENSTDSQSNPSNQGFWSAFPNIVKSLSETIKELPEWARFGALLVIAALVVTISAIFSITDNTIKFQVVLAFFLIFVLFVIFLYAFNERKNKSKNYAMDLKEAEKELDKETDKRINRLKLIQKELQDIENKLRELPFSTEIELLKTKVSQLLEDVSKDLESTDTYSQKLAAARGIDDKDQSYYYHEVEKEFGKLFNQTNENE
jgi:Ca2+/Na+ antiporter